MAIYVPRSARRRRLALVAVAAVVVGGVIGFGLGRATAPTVDDAVAEVRDQAGDAVAALQRLPIEYEQAAAGQGGESAQTITDALARARAELDTAFADAEWFGPSVRLAADDALEAVEQAARSSVPPNEFQVAVDTAVATISATFGLTG